MILEVGKLYTCRNRPDIKYVRIDAIRPEACLDDEVVVGTAFYFNEPDNFYEPGHWDESSKLWLVGCWFWIDGRYNEERLSPDDLIAEYDDGTKKIKKCPLERKIQQLQKEQKILENGIYKTRTDSRNNHLANKEQIIGIQNQLKPMREEIDYQIKILKAEVQEQIVFNRKYITALAAKLKEIAPNGQP